MSDFHKPVRARIMWDAVLIWLVVVPCCAGLTLYGLYRVGVALVALAQTQNHAMHVCFLIARAFWRF